MLCKDWLNRYAWTDVEGSITEHGQNRQIKLDGLRTWRFLYLMDFLQFMLQFSLFLFGFGLIGSFWSTNLAAASSITAIISFGVLVFASLCVSGMISENCPYRTFISVRPRALWQRVRSLVHTKTALDLRSISWILQSSLDEAVRLSAFKYLISIPELPKIHPTLVADCFHVFTGSIAFSNGKVVIRQGSEQLSTMSARCFFRTFHHLSVKDPTSGALKDLRQCYDKLFPLDTDFRGLPFQDTMTMVHILIKGRLSSGPVEWDNDGLSTQERIPLAWYMVGAAQAGYEETERKKVPRWVLRFALESLPLNPPPPSSVVADCLKIIAIDLDCDVSDITTVDERCVRTERQSKPPDPELSARVEQVSNMIARQLKTMVETTHPDQIFSKRKAISALFPYAISLERHGQRGMADEILRAAMIPFSRRFLWRRMETMLFAESSSPSLNRTITLASPYLPWTDGSYDQHAVDRWAAAALAVEYTEEVGQSVVDVLLQIASDDTLRPQIPDGVWAFLKKEVSLPPTCRGLLLGTGLDVVLHIRGRGDIDILKSYYLLVLSEWNFLPDEVVNELETSIKEDFGGARMWGHREDLISRVNYVIAQLDWGSGFLDQEKPGGVGEEAIEQAKEHYSKLRDALLKVHMETMETLTRMSPEFNDRFQQGADSRGLIQDPTLDPTQPSIALCLFPSLLGLPFLTLPCQWF